MSGRRRVPVNEMLLQEMIAGNVSVNNPVPTSVPEVQEESHLVSVDNKEQKEPGKGRKKQPGYEELYLVYNPVSKNNRQQIYIDGDLHERFTRFLKVIGGKMNVTSFVNNILQRHWEDNKEVMNELYAKNLNNPL